MDFYIIIPAYNEEAHLEQTLRSLANQHLLPKKIVVVDDGSTDNTYTIASSLSEEYPFISAVRNTAEAANRPGSKVVEAFYKGLDSLDDNYDILCKFDADLIFPADYTTQVAKIFRQNPDCGIAGGFCYIEKQGNWVLENLTNKDHIRGALKAYRKACYEQIGGLKKAMGWDTVDELLAKYHNWQVITEERLHVKHLKPTGHSYSGKAARKQGNAFKKMRYGFFLTVIATAKLALKKKSLSYFFGTITGYLNTKGDYMVSTEEGKFIRKYRWKAIKSKIFGNA